VSFRVGLFASWYFELAALRTGALSYRCRRADLNRGYEECERQTLKLDPFWLCLHGRQVRATRSFALQEEAELSRKRTRLLRAGTDLAASRASMVDLRHDNGTSFE
jgi:hypothetical protein